MSILIQFFVRLRYMVIIFLIRSHVYNFVCNTRIVFIWFINLTVRSLNKSVLVNSCVACQRVDQTDVWSFRRLNRAHTSIMGIMNISYFESGTVSGQTARSQCRKTSLMCQLTQWVVLIHKLWQLGRSEELFYRSRNRFDVDQTLWGNSLKILSCHALTNHSFQTGKTDTILVL